MLIYLKYLKHFKYSQILKVLNHSVVTKVSYISCYFIFFLIFLLSVPTTPITCQFFQISSGNYFSVLCRMNICFPLYNYSLDTSTLNIEWVNIAIRWVILNQIYLFLIPISFHPFNIFEFVISVSISLDSSTDFTSSSYFVTEF